MAVVAIAVPTPLYVPVCAHTAGYCTACRVARVHAVKPPPTYGEKGGSEHCRIT